MELLAIKSFIEQKLHVSLEANEKLAQLTVPAKELVSICDLLWRDPQTYFDSLSCLTAIDLGPVAGQMEVIYTLYSIPFHQTLHLKVVLPRLLPDNQLPIIDSLSGIWKTADWHEREIFDLVGVRFAGHPDLRRILLPEDWQGHPLRKDYQEQETYHGIQVKF